MGKYMRKAKITENVAVMEVVSQSSIGVRTRAKTLALQRLQSQPPSPESSYLQLRSRRLEKSAPSLHDLKKPQNDVRPQKPHPRTILRSGSINSGSVGSETISCSKNGEGAIRNFTAVHGKEGEAEYHHDLSIDFEPSFGENYLELDCRGRSTRESTPCNLMMRETDTAGTPGCTTRQASGARAESAIRRRNIPTSLEMEEFFASAEHHYQRLFAEKYNYDVVNDLPLPGRYEWVRVNH
ncbi:hypothetical protein NMG60_11034536 [Bertholletia excelsa]